MHDELLFIDEDLDDNFNHDAWKVLIVDDDKEVHSFTKLALNDFLYLNRSIEFVSAFSASEAKVILKDINDFAIILLDVVMETSSAGLDLASYIRNELDNSLSRIIIRTGQAGEAPERYVIEHYDINDYKEKTELTRERLFTTIRTAMVQYNQLLELISKKDELYNSLITDTLTGFPNRIKLSHDLEVKAQISLMLIDVDSFSTLNDTYGFTVGDEILIQLGHLLKEIVPDEAKVYHLEADIYAILSTDLDEDTFKVLVKRVKEGVTKHHFLTNDIQLRISCSISVVTNESDDLVQKAEIALRQARKISRNRIQVYNKDIEMHETLKNNSEWTRRITNALDSDDIIVYYQPIVDVQTQLISKYECLVRLKKDSTIHSPIEFLDTARHAGLLHQITRRVFSKACAMFSDNTKKFSINITDVDILEPSFPAYCEKIRQMYNIDASRIVLEILEESSVMELSGAVDFFETMLALGYSFSIDDFGVRCSNFAQLGNIPLHAIKIDGSFIKNIESDKDALYTVEAILFFCKKKNIKTVAEFVCSESIYKVVKELGVDFVQGYYFFEPKEYLQ
jgi:diguanylate cyclase (GGDEF)-like protein